MRHTKSTTLSMLVLLFACSVIASERSVYFYGVERLTDAQWTSQLNLWKSEGIARATVSLDAGPRFLLADPSTEKRLARFFAEAARRGVRIEGMILQDPSWISRLAEARERMRAVVEFAYRYAGTMESVQIDVEPHTAPAFVPQTLTWKEFATLVWALRQEVDRSPVILKLTAAVPWWLAYETADRDLRLIGICLDEFVMMAYGDPGSEPVAADIGTFQRKIIPAIEKLNTHARAIRVGVAIYEHVSTSSLHQFIHRVGELLAMVPSYRGTTTFLGPLL